MSNSLIKEKSPYLLEHAENPVNWFPWGEAAFERARRENKPVFLSIGYSTCHWCHVMARESFEDGKVAELLNRHFVSVKVDREERPDVDAVYMEVCTALNGSGGWPLTVIMTPEQRPFYAGTYLPRESRGGQVGLIPLLTAVAEKWALDRASLLKAGAEIRDFISRELPAGNAEPGEAFLRRAVEQLYSSYDGEYGGFGSAPKFPSAHNLIFLLRYSHLSGDKRARAAAEQSLKQMYRGGIYDHIGGGFARYSTDREWLAPHFEKTLYDNALLALAYTEAWQDGHLALYRQAAEGTLDYCLRELSSPEGGFYSGQDADSEGVEGAYYLFTPEEVKNVLGEDGGRHFCECYDITDEGNFNGKSIPNLLLNNRWLLLPEGYGEYREKLREYRRRRLPLRRDEKQLTAWNGLMLMALSRAARAFNSGRYMAAAERLARFLLEKDGGGRLSACRMAGENFHPAQLEDYAFTALGFYEFSQVSLGNYPPIKALAEEIMARFADKKGGCFKTADDAEKLIKRPKEVFDGALPSGNSAAAALFDLLWRMTGEEKWRAALDSQLRFLCSHSESYPAGCAFGLTALLSLVYPTKELLCVAEEPPESLDALMGRYAPELTLLFKRPGGPEAAALAAFAPFTENIGMKDGKPSVYLCANGACGLPFHI